VQITSVSSGYSASTLSAYDVVVLANPGGGGDEPSAAEEAALRSFTASGGGIVIDFMCNAISGDATAIFDLVGIDEDYTALSAMAASNTVYVLDPDHGLARDLPSSFTLGSYANGQNITDFDAVLLPDAEVIISSTDEANRVIAYDPGPYRGVYFTAFPGYNTSTTSYGDTHQAMYNALIWAAGY
jgi:hypothetical protein